MFSPMLRSPQELTASRKLSEMMLKILSSLTPVDETSFPYALPCIPILEQRLHSLLHQGSWNIPKPFEYDSDENSSSSASTQIAIDCFSNIKKRNLRTKKPSTILHRHLITDSIASRLPVRTKATIHRLNSVSIAYRLPSRAVNLKTRARLWKSFQRYEARP